MNIAYALLCCIGLTFILKYGSILNFVRQPFCRWILFKNLFDCALCLGFWSGIIVGICAYYINWDPNFYLLPLASSGLSWFADSVLRVVQTREILMDKRIEKL